MWILNGIGVEAGEGSWHKAKGVTVVGIVVLYVEPGLPSIFWFCLAPFYSFGLRPNHHCSLKRCGLTSGPPPLIIDPRDFLLGWARCGLCFIVYFVAIGDLSLN
jgi:hypothetical protein